MSDVWLPAAHLDDDAWPARCLQLERQGQVVLKSVLTRRSVPPALATTAS